MQRTVHLGYETLLIHVILCVWTISDFCAPLLSPMGVLCSWTCWLLVFSPKNQHKLPLSTHIHQFGYRFERMRFKLKTQWFFLAFRLRTLMSTGVCQSVCVLPGYGRRFGFRQTGTKLKFWVCQGFDVVVLVVMCLHRNLPPAIVWQLPRKPSTEPGGGSCKLTSSGPRTRSFNQFFAVISATWFGIAGRGKDLVFLWSDFVKFAWNSV